jgi:hypothetical protein
LYEAKTDFDADLSKYGIKKGVFVKEETRAVYAPVAMWLEAVDIVLQRLEDKGTPFRRIKGISGAGQQHGSVYWNKTGEELLGKLTPEETLVDQLAKTAFAHPFSPNWQDGSTQKECDKFDAELGSADELAQITGSKAHHVRSYLGKLQYQLTLLQALYWPTDHENARAPPGCLPCDISNYAGFIVSCLSVSGPHCTLRYQRRVWNESLGYQCWYLV